MLCWVMLATYRTRILVGMNIVVTNMYSLLWSDAAVVRGKSTFCVHKNSLKFYPSNIEKSYPQFVRGVLNSSLNCMNRNSSSGSTSVKPKETQLTMTLHEFSHFWNMKNYLFNQFNHKYDNWRQVQDGNKLIIRSF